MDAYVLRALDTNSDLLKMINDYETEKTEHIGLSSYTVNSIEQFAMYRTLFKVNNAIMFSTPKNQILKEYIENVINKIKTQNKSIHDVLTVQKTTGPYVFVNFFKKKVNDKNNNIHVFENTVFEPCDLTYKCNINPNTISLHQFELSWVNGFLRVIANQYIFIRKNMMYILSIIFILVVWLVRCK